MLALLEGLPDLFEEEVLKRLDPTDLALLARVARSFKTAVVASGLPQARNSSSYVTAVGCGHLEVVKWAIEQGCRF